MLMRYIKKYYLLLVFILIVVGTFPSCTPQSHYKSMLKHRRSGGSMGYRSHYGNKARHHLQPINKNFIIRNRPNRPGSH